MADKDSLGKKNKSLKLAIERYNTYKKFVDAYKSTNKLTDYDISDCICGVARCVCRV